MKTIRVALVLSVFFILFSAHIKTYEVMHSQESIDALFEEDDDSFAQEASQTAVMQQKIDVQAPSVPVYALYKVWDTILSVYLCAQGKYNAIARYLYMNHDNENCNSPEKA